MVSARGALRHEGFPYALDNGAWTAFQRGKSFDVPAFEKAISKLGDGADFIVLPDIVAGGLSSLALSREWLPRLRGLPLMLAVQDGMSDVDVIEFLDAGCGLFIGGSTDWKLATLPMWVREAAPYRARVHVGRVNTVRRIHLCSFAGADSFDGSSASKWSCTVPKLTNASRQLVLPIPNR